MSRLIDKPIPNPVLDGKKRPLVISYQGQRFRVEEIVDRWIESGRWWEGETECIGWRVRTQASGVIDLYQGRDGWRLYRIWD